MARIPETQEHFPATAMDGVYAENAGAFSGGCLDGTIPKNEEPLLGWPA
jgi:hypothetical protein